MKMIFISFNTLRKGFRFGARIGEISEPEQLELKIPAGAEAGQNTLCSNPFKVKTCLEIDSSSIFNLKILNHLFIAAYHNIKGPKLYIIIYAQAL